MTSRLLNGRSNWLRAPVWAWLAASIFGCVGGGTEPSVDGDQTGTFEDTRDGAEYTWVRIGTQVWMAENLDFVTSSGSWCYQDTLARCAEYGRLYDWEAATSACPAGWHLPSDAEWSALVDAMEPEAGAKLKVGGISRFEGTLAGIRNYDGWFVYLEAQGHFWTSTPEGMDHARERILWSDRTDVAATGFGMVAGVSVRCLRD